MKLIVIAVTISAVWIFLALVLAGCGHGTASPRRVRRREPTSLDSAMWEQHDGALRMGQDAPIPADHPLARLMLRLPPRRRSV